MNVLPLTKRPQILGLLVEGNSLRATVRLMDCSLNTITKLLVDAGTACAEFQNKTLVNLPCKRVQCDEIWSFVGAKQKNIAQGAKGHGDVWTWTAICADTKLVASWMVGSRDSAAANTFIADLAARLSNRVQLTTDGHKVYVNAVEQAFGADVDYAMLIKIFGEGPVSPERKYSPADQVGTKIVKIEGAPNMAQVSTSYVERQNLSMRRFKIEKHARAVALHFMYYNFGRIHKTLRVTPAMAAGVSDHVWSLEEIAALVPEPVAKKRGPYKKREAQAEISN